MKRNLQSCFFIFTLIFVLFFTSCSKAKNSNTETNSTKDSGFSSTVNTEDILSVATTNITTEPEKPVIATTKKQYTTTKPVATNTKVKQYSTPSEIVDLYNSCANKVKPNAKVATRNSQKLVALQKAPTSGPFASIFEENFHKGSSNEPLVCNSKELKINHFCIRNKSYTSKLQANMVSSASCTYKNGKYSILIKLKNDPVGTQDYSSTCLSVVSAKLIADTAKTSIVKEKNITATCKGCILKATIDEKTGNMLTLYYKMPTYITAKIFGTNNDFAFYIEQDWSILW
ncbi:MAG: hypothetical protein EOM05_04435 [Clostridia bacterium]|nr:hypothetical protein [Clostridia bacterium]